MNTTQYQDGELHMEQVELKKVATAFGTPVYCYSTEQIAKNYHAWEEALSSIMPRDNFTICYACKANSNMAVLRLLSRLGAGMDVVSGGELYRAFRADIPTNKTVFSGVGKSKIEITRAVQSGLLLINVESESELDMIGEIAHQEEKPARIALRVNPNVDAKTHAKITTGLHDNKFGIDIDTAKRLYHKASKMNGVAPVGVAVHIGSQLLDLVPYAAAYSNIAELVKELRADGLTIDTVDLGGGLGIPYGDETAPDFKEYARIVAETILPLNVHIVVEPGRSIVGNAGVLLTTVMHHKKGAEKEFVIIDAGMNDLMRPALYDACHRIIPCTEPEAGATPMTADIVGPVCETADTFLIDAPLPANVAVGDVLAIMTSGAYGASMSGTYNTRLLAAEVLISDRRHDQIRKVQKLEDLVGLDVIPAWLK